MSAVEPSECPLEGNSDLLGIGIRIGVYFLMFSFLLAKALPPKYSGHLQSSAIYLIYAEFIVLVRETVLRRIHGLEVEAFMWMILPQLAFILDPGPWAANFGTTYLTVVATTALSFYYVWYWYRGLDILLRTSCADEYGWFFAKVSIYHWYRTFQKVVWTFLCINWGPLFFVWTFRYFAFKDHLQRAGFQQHVALQQHVVLLVLLLPMGIAGCEMTIKWNGVTGMNSLRPVGQLVPFILSLGQLVDVIYRIFTVKLEEFDDDDVINDSTCPHSGVGDVAGGEDTEMEPHDHNRE